MLHVHALHASCTCYMINAISTKARQNANVIVWTFVNIYYVLCTMNPKTCNGVRGEAVRCVFAYPGLRANNNVVQPVSLFNDAIRLHNN